MIKDQKVIVMDLDGTLCREKSAGMAYDDLLPNLPVVEKLREYRKEGFYVIIASSRNMRTHEGNIGKINADTLKTILAWLDRHEIPYDEIHVGKPWCGHDGFYVDDRAIRPSEFLEKTPEEIRALIAKQ